MAEPTDATLYGKAVHKAEATELMLPEVMFCPVCKARVVAIRRPFKMGVKVVSGGACPCQIQGDLEAAATSSSSSTTTIPIERLFNELDILHDSYARLERDMGDQAHGIAFLKGEIRQMQVKLEIGVSTAALASRLQGIVAVTVPGIEAAIEQQVRQYVEAHVQTDGGAHVVGTLACAQQLRQDMHDLSNQLVAVRGKSHRAEQNTKRHVELLLQQMDELRTIVESDRVHYGEKDDLELIWSEFADLAQEFSSFRRVIRQHKATIDGLASLDGRVKSLETSFRSFEDMVEMRLVQLEGQVQNHEAVSAELGRLIQVQRDARPVDEIRNHRLDESLIPQPQQHSYHRQMQRRHAGIPEVIVSPAEQHRLEDSNQITTMMSNSNNINSNVRSFLAITQSDVSLPSWKNRRNAPRSMPVRCMVQAVLEVRSTRVNVTTLSFSARITTRATLSTACVRLRMTRVTPTHFGSRLPPWRAALAPLSMTRHCAHADLQGQGCRALYNLTCNNGDNRATIAANGGIEAIIQAMSRHTDHATVQELGCWALGSLACNDGSRATIAANGGIDAIVSAMRRHGDQAAVQEPGCWALLNLTCRTWRNHDNRASIASIGGIDAIVNAMRRHGARADLQEHGCFALCSLAYNDDNKVTIAAKGGIAAIVNAMTRHGAHAGLQEHGCWALLQLACNDDNNVIIASNGGIGAILNALRMHGDHAGVQKQGTLALVKLAERNDNNQALISAALIAAATRRR